MDPKSLIALVDLPDHLPLRRGRRVNIATVYRWARAGKFNVIRICGVMYATRDSIDALMSGLQPEIPVAKSPPSSVIDAGLRANGLT